MVCLVKALGRILFVTILVSSAYLHLNNSETYVTDFTANYSHLTKYAGKHDLGALLPTASTVRIKVIIDRLAPMHKNSRSF